MPGIPLGPFADDSAYAEAVARDGTDPLRQFRSEFAAQDPSLIYLDGNSLGRLPNRTVELIRDTVENQWGTRLNRSWRERWWTQADAIGSMIAPIVGAGGSDVIVADSTSVALFKLTVGALRARPDRGRILTDDLNFPTDLYVTSAAADLAGGREVVMVPSADGIAGPEDALLAALDDDTALLTLSHVAFKSGYLYDMERLTKAAHDVGALVLWDLSHSVGAVPIDLTAAGVDLAVGCTYKYLNGGPGSPAFLYVSRSLDIENPLSGWWGHTDPFAFDTEYEPAASIKRFQTGTMPIISMVAIEPGVTLTARAGMDAIRTKSVALSEFFVQLSDRLLEPLGFTVASPRDPEQRGSHVSMRHADGWRVSQVMIDHANLIPDFRPPDNIRFGFAPLYTSFLDVHTAVLRITELFAAGTMARYSSTRDTVS